jgi:hypothetical protein
VLRSTLRPTYDEEANRQVQKAREKLGPGELHKLLHSGERWTVGTR